MIQTKVADTSDSWKSHFYTLNIYPTFDGSTTENLPK